MVVEAKLAQDKKANAQAKLFSARKDLLIHLATSASPEEQQKFYAYTNAPFNVNEFKFRPSPREIIINPRPVVGPTSSPSPTVSPGGMVMGAWLVAVYIIEESIQSGHESYKARKTIEFLFDLYKALDEASLLVDFDKLFGYKVIDPTPADKGNAAAAKVSL